MDEQSIASSTVAYEINLLLDNSKKANNVTSHKVSQPQFLKRNQFKCLRKCFLSVSGCVCNSSAIAEWGSWHSLSKLANPSVIFFFWFQPTLLTFLFFLKNKLRAFHVEQKMDMKYEREWWRLLDFHGLPEKSLSFWKVEKVNSKSFSNPWRNGNVLN